MPTIQNFGPSAHLLTWATQDPTPIHHLAQQLQQLPITREITLGYNTLLIQTKPHTTTAQLKKIISQLPKNHHNPTPKTHHNIIVQYNGPDLTEIAATLNLTPAEIIRLHSTPTYTVRFLGFTPGFPYLDGLDPLLHIPRRPSPRTHIPPGSVAIANGYTSIYTIKSPGGWNLLGTTEHPIFDPEQNNQQAFTLHPGDTLNFIPA